MTPLQRLLIVGGGVSGLTLAAALARQGVAVDMAELKRDWSVLGVGFTITGPTLRALAAIGVRERCIEAGFGFDRSTICNERGEKLQEVAMPRVNGPDRPASIGILRPALHAILSAAAQDSGARIRLGLTVAALRQDEDAVAVEFSDGSAARYDLVVGADGFRSAVRALAFPDAPALRFTGQIVWRVMLRRPVEVESLYQFFGRNGKPGFVPCPDQKMLLFFTQNMNGRARLSEAGLPVLLREALGGFGGLMAEARAQITDDCAVSYRNMDTIFVPPPWYRHRVVLIGDAAHVPGPYLSSGAGMAVEDAVVLAEALTEGGSVPPALASFMVRRFERCRMVVENSLQLAAWERDPTAPGADSAGLMARSWAALAQPI